MQRIWAGLILVACWHAAPAPAVDLNPKGISTGLIYKCRSASGADVYSDEPCAAKADMQELKLEPAALPDIADIGPQCDSADGARLDLAELDRATLSALPAGQRQSVNDALADYARWGSREGARWGRGQDGAVHLCLPTFANKIVEFIATADGKLIQVRGGMVAYRNDPDTPAALLERCAQTFNQCLQAPGASADSCVAQVPTCATREPWKGGRNCCPLECKDGYQNRRASGVSGESAFLSALYETPSCVPGLELVR